MRPLSISRTRGIEFVVLLGQYVARQTPYSYASRPGHPSESEGSRKAANEALPVARAKFGEGGNSVAP
jgi:hypothetical protein